MSYLRRGEMMLKIAAKFSALWAMICGTFLFLLPPSGHAAANDYKIEINKKTNYLYLYNHGKVVKTYRVATGRTSQLTPTGTFVIGVKIIQPGWKNIPGGHPNNPLGSRWLGLVVNQDRARTYGIHGTNDPKSIGTNASSGCIRMHNKDVMDLYNRIDEGVPVWIHAGHSNNQWRGNANIGLKQHGGKIQVTASVLNVRTGPTTGSFIIGKVKRGSVLTLAGSTSHWYQVRLSNGKIGFVSKQYAIRR